MKKKADKNIVFEDYLGCFGDFSIEDKVCKKLCALNMRCAIEREYNDQLEILEELASYENMFIKVQ